jgi:hypothetical protein
MANLIQLIPNTLAESDQVNANFNALNTEMTQKVSNGQLALMQSQLTSLINNNIDALSSSLENTISKAGDIKPGAYDIPDVGWLLCDGSEVSRADYEDLFDRIGTNFGEGDGTATFNIPDFRGRFLKGVGGSSTSIGMNQDDALPNILASWNIASEWGWQMAVTGAAILAPSGGTRTQNATAGNRTYMGFDASIYNSIYDNDVNEVRTKNCAVNYFIKY